MLNLPIDDIFAVCWKWLHSSHYIVPANGFSRRQNLKLCCHDAEHSPDSPDAGWTQLMDWCPMLIPGVWSSLKHPLDKLGPAEISKTLSRPTLVPFLNFVNVGGQEPVKWVPVLDWWYFSFFFLLHLCQIEMDLPYLTTIKLRLEFAACCSLFRSSRG